MVTTQGQEELKIYSNYCNINTLQVYTEFELMCGENAIQTIQTNWRKYAPNLCDIDDSSTQESGIDTDLEALQILDRKVQTISPSADSPAAFSLHEGHHNCINTHNHVIVPVHMHKYL